MLHDFGISLVSSHIFCISNVLCLLICQRNNLIIYSLQSKGVIKILVINVRIICFYRILICLFLIDSYFILLIFTSFQRDVGLSKMSLRQFLFSQ